MNATFSNQNQTNQAQFMRHEIVDPQNQGLTVAAFEHPHKWQAQSQVVWNFQNTSQPVSIYAAAVNPNGAEALEFLPIEAFYWLEPNYGFDSVGQNKFGMICMPPMAAADTMIRCVIHKYRGNRRNLQIIAVREVPNLPQILNEPQLAQQNSESISVKIEYEENGRLFTEEFVGLKTLQQAHGGMSVQINWGFARLICFRAEKGNFAAQNQLFWRIVCSVKTNPSWLQIYQQILQQLNNQFQIGIQNRYAELQQQAQFQHQLTDFYQQQRDNQNANIAYSIESQNQINQDRSNQGISAQEAWRNELGGATAYQDPNSAEGNYHYHYEHKEYVWTDGQGNFHGTDNPNEDPNINSDRNWTLAKKA